MKHHTLKVRGANIHVVTAGKGTPLLLLHDWPEFWLTWEPVMKRLADRFMLVAPDLRGFGESDKPTGPFGPPDHALDLIALMDALQIKKFGVIGHDVGGAVIQPLARLVPDQIIGLFLFNFFKRRIQEQPLGAPWRL